MCHNRANNSKINRLHNALLKKDDSVSIHIRNIHILSTETYHETIMQTGITCKKVFRRKCFDFVLNIFEFSNGEKISDS